MNKSIPIEQSSTKALKKQIYCLRKTKSRLEKYPIGDIRYYFDLNNNANIENIVD